LAVNADYLFVGRSEYGDRGDRTVNDGGLWVIDRTTLTTIEQVRFPGSGCVNEIRLLDGPDECHNGEQFDDRLLAMLAHDSQPAEAWDVRRLAEVRDQAIAGDPMATNSPPK
jgi:hypothetical protein